MKPLFLKLKGINSYREEQTIDFSALTSQGLFGIFGPTGSGKSSILDAITLALYARLPRATKNYIHISETSATVSFRFSITTDRTRTFCVERSFKYHNSSSSPSSSLSTVRNVTGRLLMSCDGVETVLADKPTDVTRECTRLLGLTSDDFMRTVVLPQGQFSEFLKLKNAERRDMLQRIFHLEKYGLELTGKIAKARQKQDILLSRLEGERKTYEKYSMEHIKILEKEAKEKEEKIASLIKKKDSLQKLLEESGEILSLEEELRPLEEQFKQQQNELPRIQETEKKLDISKKALLVYPFSKQAKQAHLAYEEAISFLKASKLELEELTAQYKKIQKKQEETSILWERDLPLWQQKLQQLETASQISLTIKKWNIQKQELEKEREKTELEISRIKQETETLASKETMVAEEISTMEQSLDEERISPEYKKVIEDGHVMEENYRTKHTTYQQNKKLLQQVEKELHAGQQTLSLLQANLSALYHDLCARQAEKKELLSRLEKEIEALEAKEKRCQQQLEDWQQAHMAQSLRLHLKAGDLCPVCGSPLGKHDFPLHEEKEEDTSLPARIQKERTAFEEQTASCIQQKKELEKELTHLSSCKKMMEQTEDFTESGEVLPVKTEDSLSDIPSKLNEFSQEKGRLQKQQSQFAGQQAQLSKEYQALSHDADLIFHLRKEYHVDHFSDARHMLQTKEEERHKQEQLLKEKRGERQKLTQKKDESLLSLHTLSEHHSSLLSSLQSAQRILEEQQNHFPEGFSLQMDFEKEILKTKTDLENLKKQKKEMDSSFQQISSDLKQKEEQHSVAKSRVASASSHVKQADTLLEEQLKAQGFQQDEELSPYYMEQERILQAQQEIDQYYLRLQQTTERKSYLLEKLQNRHMDKDTYEEHQRNYDTAKREEELEKSNAALLRHTIAEEKKRLEEKEILEKTWEKETHTRDLIRELEHLFKGNAFIEYVAQSKLTYIASEASSILFEISGGAYCLEMNEATEFIIRDNKNGGVKRPSDTLSGGETFITSLSLALALSSSIQLNGAAPLEFFFLDEGFGSLDDDLLDTVMTSLERLQNRKGSIGIISHVEAIQARVPVKLIVTPSDIPQNGSTIHLEYS